MTGQDYLKRIFHQILRFFRISFYFYPQKYSVDYRINIRSSNSKARTFSLIIPIPQSFKDQQIISNIKISVDGKYELEDVFHNQYYVAPIKLKASSSRLITMTLTASVLPIIEDDFRLCQSNNKTNGFIESIKPPSQSVRDIYKHVVKQLIYGGQIKGLYSSNSALYNNRVDCGGFTTLFCAYMWGLGLDCTPAFGFFVGYKNNTMHAWAESKTQDNKTIPFDLSQDKLFQEHRSVKSGGFGWVGSDRVVFSRGCDYDIEINGRKKRIGILQHPLIFPTIKNISISTMVKTNNI